MRQVWAIMMVKDEADVVLSTLKQLANERVDGIIVADNGSTDDTRGILEFFKAQASIPVLIMDDDEVAYEQSRKMTNLARLAHEQGADWIVPVDADECWFNRGDSLGDYLRAQRDHVVCVRARLFNHFRTALDVQSEDIFESIVYRQGDASPLPKVACRWRPDLEVQMGNHEAKFGGSILSVDSSLEIRHFPYRSPEQIIRKARNGGRAYAATNFDASVGAHWRQYHELIERYGEASFIEDVWEKYYYFVSPSDGGMVHDPAPYLRWK